MKTSLNSLKWATLALTFSFLTTSCDLFNKDKEDPKPATNEITYNSTKYTLDESLMIKYGSFSVYGDEDTHVNNDFYIANGNIDYNNSTGNVEEINGNLAIHAELASPGATEFKTGTFNYIDGSNDNSLSEAQLEAKYKNKPFFEAGIYIDTNGNGLMSDETPVKANGGTIKVSGSNNTYTLDFDLTLTNGKTLKGRNASTFSAING